jgi:uncharacterized repeat protein (TIGR01451 family)
MSSTHSLSRAQGHASYVSRSGSASAHQLLSSSSSSSSSSFSPFPALGSASSSASRQLADSTACGINGSGFEDKDGNLAVNDTVNGCTDWNSFAPVTWTGTAPYQTTTGTANGFNLFGVSDGTGSSGDTTYTPGTKQNAVCPTTVQNGSVPNKDDLARIYLAGEKIGAEPFLFLAWVRAPQNTINSNLHAAFEFNQSQTACSNGDGLVNRTVGDLLIGYEFQSATPTITIATWQANNTWSAATTLNASQAEAAVNTTTAATPDAIKPPSGLDPGQDAFGEVGIDLGAIIPASQVGCLTFGTVSGASRSSGSSTTSNMEDLVGPQPIDISNCATPSVSTTLSAVSPVSIGASVHDSATLPGATTDAGGTISYGLFSDSTCTTQIADLTNPADNTVVNGVAPDSLSHTFNSAGTFYFQATYSGDANNTGPVSSPCTSETLVVGLNAPTIATTLSNLGPISIGTAVHDSATLTGATSNAGGTISYGLFSNDTCAGTPVADLTNPADNTVVNGVVPDSLSHTFNSAGTFYFQATYSGDGNNGGATSACTSETLVVNPNEPSVSTLLVPAGPVAIGTSVHDSATLTGATTDAGGTISYGLFSDNTCSTLVADLTPTVNTVTGGVVPDSNPYTFNSAGTFYFQATYSGDNNNGGGTSVCTSETLVVNPNTPTVSTLLVPAGPISTGTTVHDSATLSSVTADAGGTVTYSVYSDSSCATKVADGGTVNVTAGSVPNSNDITFNTPGTFYWQASYSGDANNTAAVSPCTSEKLVVAPLIDLAVTKVGSPSPITVGQGNITWTMVVTNNGPDTATGVTISDPLPTGNTFVSVSTNQGSCTGGAIISCNLGTIAAGGTVTITLVTTPTVEGTVTNTVTVVGNETETNTANNTASASVVVNGFTPPVFCVAVSKVTPEQLFVGRKTGLTIHLTQNKKAVKGVHVLIKGPKLLIRTGASNAKGIVKQTVKMKKAGIVIFTPIASKRCNTKRVGVTGVFTPPVTG